MSYVNPIMLVLDLAAIALAVCAWQTPQFLRRWAAKFLARAQQLDLRKRHREESAELYRQSLAEYEGAFHCVRRPEKPVPETWRRWGRKDA